MIVVTAKDLNPAERAALEQRVRGLLLKGGTTPAQLLGHLAHPDWRKGTSA